MKIYKISKKALKWKEIPQIDYKWNLPILVNSNLEVVLGNSLKDSLSDSIIIVIMDNDQREPLFDALYVIETRIAEENSISRIDRLYVQIRDYLREVRKPYVEQVELFSMKEDGFITPENFIETPPYDFTKHRHSDELYNEGCVLMEEFIEKVKGKEPEIKIDLEIMKELL